MEEWMEGCKKVRSLLGDFWNCFIEKLVGYEF